MVDFKRPVYKSFTDLKEALLFMVTRGDTLNRLESTPAYVSDDNNDDSVRYQVSKSSIILNNLLNFVQTFHLCSLMMMILYQLIRVMRMTRHM